MNKESEEYIKESAVQVSPFEHHSFGHKTWVDAFEAGAKWMTTQGCNSTECTALYKDHRANFKKLKVAIAALEVLHERQPMNPRTITEQALELLKAP